MPQMSARASGSKHTLASPDVSHAIEEDWAFDDFSQEPSPITPREQPNHPRQRSCKVARKLCTPTRSAQSSVERLHLDPFEPEPLMLNDEFQSGLQKVFEAFDVICAERNAREYTSLFEKLGARRLSEIFVRSLAKQSIPLVQALWKGQLPSSEDLGRAPRIAACSDINVSGVYIHVARDGEIPFASGAYIGSGAAEKGDTNFGMSNISGVLERVWCQHGSQAFRKYQDDKSRGNRGVAHYRMYKAGDTPQQHHYVLLSYLTFDEVKTLLHHAQATIDQAELHERYALTRSFEAVFIITTGMYTNDKQVMDSIKEFGWEVPQPSILRLNRSAGLEVSSPEDHTAHLARSRAGGLAAQLTYGKAMGLGVGEKGSLTGYLHAKGWQNPDLPKEAAEAGRDKVYKDSLMLWMNEKFIRRAFRGHQVPGFMYTSSRDFIQHHLPHELLGHTISEFTLNVGLRKMKFGDRVQSASAWQRPSAASLVWSLDIGVLDENGLPRGNGMILTPWKVTDNNAILQDEAAVCKAAEDPDKRQRIERYPGDLLDFSLATAVKWDQEPDKMGKKPRAGNIPWTHVLRFRCFAAFIRASYEVRLISAAWRTLQLLEKE